MKVPHAVTDATGTRWYDERGRFHRDGGPAKRWPNGMEEWYQHGNIHREDGPACVAPTRGNTWYLNDFRVWDFKEFQRITGCSDDHIVFLKLKWGEI